MANHGYVIFENLPSPEAVNKALTDFLAERFPCFKIECDNDYWYISAKEDDDRHFGFELWLSDYEMRPCVEFRHGHAYSIQWWIEREIQIALAKAIGGEVEFRDDGHDIVETLSQKPSFNTFKEYCKRSDVMTFELETLKKAGPKSLFEFFKGEF